MNPSAKEMWYMGNNADAIQARVGLDKVLVKPHRRFHMSYMITYFHTSSIASAGCSGCGWRTDSAVPR